MIWLQSSTRCFPTLHWNPSEAFPFAYFCNSNETSKMMHQIAQWISNFHQCCLQKIFNVTYGEWAMYTETLWRSVSCQDRMAKLKMHFVRHVLHLPKQCQAKTAIMWTPAKGKLKGRRPWKMGSRTFHKTCRLWCPIGVRRKYYSWSKTLERNCSPMCTGASIMAITVIISVCHK